MEIQQDRERLSFLFQTNISFYFFRSTLGSDLNKTSWNITLQREIEVRMSRVSLDLSEGGVYAGYISGDRRGVCALMPKT